MLNTIVESVKVNFISSRDSEIEEEAEREMIHLRSPVIHRWMKMLLKHVRIFTRNTVGTVLACGDRGFRAAAFIFRISLAWQQSFSSPGCGESMKWSILYALNILALFFRRIIRTSDRLETDEKPIAITTKQVVCIDFAWAKEMIAFDANQ